ncbi:unnamed protein product [Prorocentrum cordatum]|uniref:PPPDE domain-containing protein n=1 Tax=Prorocentrum cordatum TaxID=2364126 RepID=A0ABN9QZA3_9DINO|nr:unnamed protein product [Polarella glacialis]
MAADAPTPPHEGQLAGGARAPVRLSLYDLDGCTGWLLNGKNGSRARWTGLGLFHCAIEVHDWEFAFVYYWDCWESDQVTGVIRSPPRQDPTFGVGFRGSLELGSTRRSPAEVTAMLQDLGGEWRSNRYHLIRRNCVTFCEELAGLLEVQLSLACPSIGGIFKTSHKIVWGRCFK